MNKDTKIKIGVIGVGHLGHFHLKQLKGIPNVSISGLYDSNPKRAVEMSHLHNVHSYSSLDEILDKSDAVSIVTPTSKHYSVADKALNEDCNLFIEKPITDNIDHAGLLLNKAKKLKKINPITRSRPPTTFFRSKFIYFFVELKHFPSS